MKLISYADFEAMRQQDRYYNPERWQLYSTVLKLIRQLSPATVLELGPHKLPLVLDGDTMDRKDTLPPTIQHDARQTPWPIADQQYDLFVALQVWEHLDAQQVAAFREVQRIARRAILSFPYRWDCRHNNPSHHGIDETVIAAWTENVPPVRVILVDSSSNHRRIIYLFDFEVSTQFSSSGRNRPALIPVHEPIPTLRRAPHECRYRYNVQADPDRNEVARCRFIEDQLLPVDLNFESCVGLDACQVCIEQPEPLSNCWNNVVSPLILREVMPRLNVAPDDERLKKLEQRAIRGLPLLHRKQQRRLPVLRTFGDCLHCQQETAATMTTSAAPTQPEAVASGAELSIYHRPCTHPQHHWATTSECQFCPDYRNRQQAPRTPLLERLPLTRQGRPVRDWMVGVTTSPRSEPTLDLTLDSIRRAGWSTPWLFLDGSVPIAARHAHLPVTFRENRTGAWPNYFLALAELIMRNPDADAYLLFQDDVELAAGENVRAYLEQILWPANDVGVVSLFTSSAYDRPHAGWYRLEDRWIWGALTMIFSNKAAWSFLSDPEVVAHRRSLEFNGMRQIDVTIGRWAKRQGYAIMHPVPSLVQHIGDKSTLWEEGLASGNRKANSVLQ